jgi:hypothetical protein
LHGRSLYRPDQLGNPGARFFKPRLNEVGAPFANSAASCSAAVCKTAWGFDSVGRGFASQDQKRCPAGGAAKRVLRKVAGFTVPRGGFTCPRGWFPAPAW